MNPMDPAALNAWRGLLSSWDGLLLTVVLAVVVPTMSYLRFRLSPARGDPVVPTHMKLKLYARIVYKQWFLVAMMLSILRHHGMSKGDAGQRLANAGLTLGVTLALLSILAVVSAIVLTRLRRAQAKALSRATASLGWLAPTFGAEMAPYVCVCLTVGICEELLYRGWLVSVCWAATGSAWVALALAAIAFGTAHGHQGPLAMLRTAFVGLQLGVLFVWVGSLIPGQVLHVGVDLLVGAAGALAMSRLSAAGAVPPAGCSTNAATSA